MLAELKRYHSNQKVSGAKGVTRKTTVEKIKEHEIDPGHLQDLQQLKLELRNVKVSHPTIQNIEQPALCDNPERSSREPTAITSLRLLSLQSQELQRVDTREFVSDHVEKQEQVGSKKQKVFNGWTLFRQARLKACSREPGESNAVWYKRAIQLAIDEWSVS